jgi:molecular chaperone DnaK (HSP70)
MPQVNGQSGEEGLVLTVEQLLAAVLAVIRKLAVSQTATEAAAAAAAASGKPSADSAGAAAADGAVPARLLIAVPDAFTEEQRQAVLDAAVMAGWARSTTRTVDASSAVASSYLKRWVGLVCCCCCCCW